MDRLKRSFRDSFKKKKGSSSGGSVDKPHQWQQDESAVRSANCNYPVKVGCFTVKVS